MKAWRIEKQKRLATARTGEGARLTGGRWNSSGHAVIYASSHLSLGVLEVLVHAPMAEQRQVARAVAEISLADSAIEIVPAKALPKHFSHQSPHAVTQALGDAWLQEKRSVGLLVPSAIIPTEHNLLLNPEHPDFKRAAWGDFLPLNLDPRLWLVPGGG